MLIGLADTFMLMRYPFDSSEAKELNKKIFETIYHAGLEASCELAELSGPYETYTGSPVSKGILQYDMWNVEPSDLWDWDELKKKIAKHGVRNSLLVAPMPTASTSQILGFNECFEPYTSVSTIIFKPYLIMFIYLFEHACYALMLIVNIPLH